ncbi:hypothetical protein [Nostoc sp.]|uniref:hypothetical protein n=1 Tax=Nostoc sp. TaxID=1180 RepID=UPI002FFA0D7B
MMTVVVSVGKGAVIENIANKSNDISKRLLKNQGINKINSSSTITKKGRDYPQAYYRAQENGHKKSKYIPK